MQDLALRIYKGTHGAPPDERPLVSVGAVPDTFSPIVPTLVDEPETWVLVHRYDYTLYVYQVTQEDTTYRQICLLVPVGIRLSADNNPYGLLLELWGILESQGNQHALFEERLALSIIGKQVSDMRLPVMDGQQPASYCADSRMQVKALLMFSQYPQLARVSRLEIGLHCASTISLPIKANPKKPPQPKTILQSEVGKNQAAPSVKEDVEDIQTYRKRSNIKNILYPLYAFFLIVAIIGFIFSKKEKQAVSSNIVSSIDSMALKKTAPTIDKSVIVIGANIEMVDSAPSKSVEKIRIDSKGKEREQAREEILELVNRQIRDCMHSKEKGMKQSRQVVRAHSGWKYLSNEERWAVEAILGNPMKTLRGPGRIKFEKLMKERFPFRSFNEIIATRKDMVIIIAKYGEE